MKDIDDLKQRLIVLETALADYVFRFGMTELSRNALTPAEHLKLCEHGGERSTLPPREQY